MNYTFLSDFCTTYRMPKIQEKLNTFYTRILTKKYHIPELKWPGIPYTQNPWPGLENVTPSIKNYVALLPWFRDCHFDSSVSSNVRCATCSHGTDCHEESPAGKVSLIEKSNFAKGKLTRRTKNEPLGCKYLFMCVSKLEVFTQYRQLPLAYHENS